MDYQEYLERINELEIFIIKTFNLLNGKINSIPATLKIKKERRNIGAVATTFLNRIYFNLDSLNIDCIEYSKESIICVLVHELLHVDQNIETDRLFSEYDPLYKMTVETDVEYSTLKILKSKKFIEYIKDNLNFEINIAKVNYMLEVYYKNYISGYNKKTLYQFYFYLLNSISFNNIDRSQYDFIMNNSVNIKLLYNNKYYIIKENGNLNLDVTSFIEVQDYYVERSIPSINISIHPNKYDYCIEINHNNLENCFIEELKNIRCYYDLNLYKIELDKILESPFIKER